MVEVTEDTMETLQDIAGRLDEKDIEDVQETFKKKYDEISERTEGVNEERIEEFAVRQTRTQLMNANRVPSDHVEILTIGGDIRDTNNGDMFFGSGLVDENPNEDNSNTKLCSVRIFDSELASEIYTAFSEVGNVVSGEFNVSEGDLTDHAEVSDVDETSIEVTRLDDKSAVVSEIRSKVPEVNIATIADNLSAESRGEDGNMYVVGSDLRRIEADVYDAYKNPDEGYGMYTVGDDTVFDEADFAESDVFNPDESNENATPGMTCFCDPNQMEYGSESVIEFYGTLTTNENGEVTMNVDGMIPILPTDFDGYEDSSDDDEMSEMTGNVDTSNVDRTTI
jgi:hypothetical protein